MLNIRKTVTVSLLACMALCIYAVEIAIPYPLPVPGAKIGLSNVVTLAAFYIAGRKEAFSVLAVRIFLSALLFGNMMSVVYSIAGGVLCYLVTLLLSCISGKEHIWALGIAGALSHNLGQILVAVVVLQDARIMYYYLYMIIISVVTGGFTGLCATYAVKAFDKINICKKL